MMPTAHLLASLVAICPACREHLEVLVGGTDMPLQWWADKAISEHLAEYHD